MTEPTISWNDILEVGQGGPGCGQLFIDGKQPKGAFRYLPPALVHDGKVFASTFVPRRLHRLRDRPGHARAPRSHRAAALCPARSD